jgi:hypothetical protein
MVKDLSKNFSSALLFLILFCVSCGSMRMISGRSPYQNDNKNLTRATSVPLPVTGGKEAPQEVYIKAPQINIVETDPVNTTGSLYNTSNDTAFLFGELPKNEIGSMIEVAVNPSATPAAAAAQTTAAAPGAAAPVAGAAAAGKNGKSAEDDLLAQFPDLKPQDVNQKIIKNFKMKVQSRYPNGDVLALYYRTSDSASDANEVKVLARIPGDKLQEGKGISTQDLSEVQLIASNHDELLQRQSPSWEDEYTLRMSGFREATSKSAKDLESKRKDLMKIKDTLHKRIEDLAKERERMAKERDHLALDHNKDLQTIQELKAQLQKQNADQSTQTASNAPAATTAATAPAAKPAATTAAAPAAK